MSRCEKCDKEMHPADAAKSYLCGRCSHYNRGTKDYLRSFYGGRGSGLRGTKLQQPVWRGNASAEGTNIGDAESEDLT